jgi:hypothetical protein
MPAECREDVTSAYPDPVRAATRALSIRVMRSANSRPRSLAPNDATTRADRPFLLLAHGSA